MATDKARLLVTLGELDGIIQKKADELNLQLSEYIRYLIIKDNISDYEYSAANGIKSRLPRGCNALYELAKRQQGQTPHSKIKKTDTL